MSDIAFNLNLFFLTEMSFIHNKAKKSICKKGRDGTTFCEFRNKWPKIAEGTLLKCLGYF